MTPRKTEAGVYITRVRSILIGHIHAAARHILNANTFLHFINSLSLTSLKLFLPLRSGIRAVQPVYIFYLLLIIAVSTALPQSRYTYYGANEGLSQLNVRSIIQDHSGFLWVGTWDGLNRFDGYHFRIFQNDLTESNSISNNNILAVSSDSKNRIWTLFPNGQINIYNRESGSFRLIKHSDGSPLVSSTFHTPQEDSNGYFWTGRDDTLRRIHPENFAIQNFPAVEPDSTMPDRAPELVLADRRKIYLVYLPSSFYVRRLDFDYYSLLVTSKKKILLSTLKGELFEYVPQTGAMRLITRFTSSKGAPVPVYSLYEDTSGNLWVGTTEGIFCRENFSAEKKQPAFFKFPYTADSETRSEPVYTIFKDYSGVLWAGTLSGLFKINPVRKKFNFLPSGNNFLELFGDSFPVSMLKTGDGKMLIGTTNGMYEYDPESGTAFRFTRGNSGYAGHAAFFIYKAPDGGIWIGSRHGLNKYDVRTKRFKEFIFAPGSGLSPDLNRIYAITASQDGRYWAGSVGGLIEFSPKDGSHKVHTFNSNLFAEGKSYILSLLVEGDILWAGTNGEGLLRISLEDMSFKRFTALSGDHNSLSGNKIMALHRDVRGRLWIATMGGGLNLLSGDETSFRRFTIKEGLSNNTVYGILEDNRGDIWVSTNAGLNRISADDFKISVYGSNDIPSVKEFNQNSYYKSPDGQLFFGGMRGIISFRPEEIETNPHPPRLVLTRFLVFNKPRPDLSNGSDIRLKYNENFFSVELSALLFDDPGSNQYAYRLKGLHDQWIYIGARRMVDFSFIEPGEYIFMAKAANKDGIWSKEQELARIIIVPPFWRTGWFYAFVTLLITGAVFLSVRYYIQKQYKARIAKLEQEKLLLEERNKTRDRIARDLHDDLASTVSSAGLYLQSARQMLSGIQNEALRYLDKSTSILNKAEQSMSDIVWSVSPNYDSLDNLILRVRLFAQELCAASGLQLDFSYSGDGKQNIGEELRRNIYLAGKECIVNAVRHSSCSELQIRAAVSDERIIIIIRDNGIGFTFSESKSSLGGNGLINIRKRLHEINGSAEFVSEQGGGTTVTLSAPLSAAAK